jgi:hypothetical protein
VDRRLWDDDRSTTATRARQRARLATSPNVDRPETHGLHDRVSGAPPDVEAFHAHDAIHGPIVLVVEELEQVDRETGKADVCEVPTLRHVEDGLV